MTSDLLIDSCVLVKLVMVETDSEAADRIVESTLKAGFKVAALDFARIEVGNVNWKSWYRGLIHASDAESALAKSSRIVIEYLQALPHLSRALTLGLKFRIAIYDALFVAAVESLDCQGVTSDLSLLQKIQTDYPQIQSLR